MTSSNHEHLFRLSEHGEAFVSRRAGAAVLQKLIELDESVGTEKIIVIEMTDVDVMTPSFADECIGRLAARVGLERFRRRFRLVVVLPELRSLINAVVRNRIAMESSRDTGVDRAAS